MELESRFTQPRPDCPHPERWHSPDADSTEIEVSRLVAAFVQALRPDFVIETGTAFGQTAELIGQSLVEHGGDLLTFETDPDRVLASTLRCENLPVTVKQTPSLTGIAALLEPAPNARGSVGFAWLDSLFELRVPELRAIRPLLMSGAIVGIHDCGEPGRTKYNDFAASVAQVAANLGFNRISLPTPRGCTFLQWKG